ncbi:MAG: hypothetical protein KBC84_01755 [Proteobacteria bacterium]|nr:hypothetical protein [Pseudomonadota bacterium]
MSMLQTGAALKVISTAVIGQNPNPAQSTPADVAKDTKKAAAAADTVLGSLLSKANLPDVAKSMYNLATLVTKGNASVLELDKAVKNLDADVPGTTKLVKELSTLTNSMSKAIPDKDIPSSFKPLADKTKTMVGDFDNFMTKYEDYKNSGTFNRWWNGKAVSTLTAWNKFKSSYGEVEKEATSIENAIMKKGMEVLNDPSKILTDPSIKQTANDAAKLGTDAARFGLGVLRELAK